jgi:bifunctional ADP-heptose synthase (sugar kinase/adenylyltransferase)
MGMGRPVTLVTGYFDVLRARHIDALERAARPDRRLLVALRDGPDSILPLRARAELVAALRMVDYVVTADEAQLDALISSLKPAQTVRLEEDDRAHARELKLHVQRRQSC